MQIRVKSRASSFLFILAIYAFAFFIGLLVFYLFNNMLGSTNFHVLVSFFLADFAATLIVWSFGLLFANSSVYDPYWSVAPVVILVFWMMPRGISFTITDILFLVAVVVWAVRLTLNWAIRWKGLDHQDWRYVMLKEKTPHLWFLTNLVGINVMPTIIVFLALIPAYFGIGPKGALNNLTVLGFAMCAVAVLIQAIADKQMDFFRENKSFKNQCIDRGLWRYSRHPNYFGEVLFWWGIWLMQMGVTPQKWATVIGPVVMTLLFLFVSIPMMERYILLSKTSYNSYQKQVSMFLPWFRTKSGNNMK
jgi:steroid 5-alpha reductase family enzyme